MMRAPRSASWRVQNGAAIACSSETTVMPSSGLGLTLTAVMCGTSSSQLGAGLHGEPAFLVLRPQAHRLAVLGRLLSDAERVQVERRSHGLELETAQERLWRVLSHELGQQRSEQRPVHHQTWIAFDLRHIATVVVDAVAIERQRR